VYGTWPYPEYPPYYYPPPAGWVVGGAIATGLAWGAAYAVGREIWDDIDWHHGDIDIDIDRNVNIDADRNFNKWEHNSYHRRGVAYNSGDVKNKFNKANINTGDRNLDFRGHSGNQVLKPDGKPGGGGRLDGGFKPGGDNRPGGRPDIGGGERPGGRPDIGQIEKGLKDRAGKPGNLAKSKGKGPSGGNAFDLSDGPKAKDFAKRGQASLGNRGSADFKRPSAKAPKSINRGGGRPPQMGRPGGGRGGGHISRGSGGGGFSRGGGRGGGGGGRGGGGRRSDIRLKHDIVELQRLDNGLELYRFRYKGGDRTLYVGVMAQEVQKTDPNAVSRGRDGYLRVDYDRIGVKFMTWGEWVRLSVAKGVRQ
jgi:hypothetical protein